MKKILLKESQVKYIIDTTISEQLGDPEGRDRKAERQSRRAEKNQRLTGPFDWNGGVSGSFNFLSMPYGAVNVFKGFSIARHTMASKTGKAIPGKQTPPQQTPPQKQEPVLSTFTVQGSSLPYADNMVKPYFDKYPDALGTFNEILRRFVEYIKNGGGPNLTNVTIKGSADSAAPTTVVPAGYSKLDHPSGRPYNGLTDPMERNQYLADTRASEYAKVLSYKVKEQTGFDLNIKVLPGDNYYGQAGKRGDEFRSIVLTPNAGELKKVDQPASETPGTITPATSEPGQNVKIPSIPYKVAVFANDEGRYVNGYNVIEKATGNNFLGVSMEDAESMGLPTFDDVMESKIEGGKLFMGNNLVGEIDTINNAPSGFETFGKNAKYFAGPITTIRAVRNNEIDGQGMVSVAYLDQTYFLFY